MPADRDNPENQLADAILDLDKARAQSVTKRMLDDGADPHGLIDRVIKTTADEIGRKFRCEEFFLPQLMLAGQALEGAMNVVLEAVPTAADGARRTVVIGTVKGDIHTIGKNVVAMMLRTGGFDVRDLGVDVASDTFVRQAERHDADIIALSSLLTTTLGCQRDVIESLKAAGLRDRFRVMVGGGPATRDWADQIGADGFGNDAAEAVTVARRLVEQKA